MSFDALELRKAFGSFMTGVTVVTTVSESGEKIGFTANSFTSVSIDPPLVLVCPAKNLNSFDIFNTCQHFAINILTEDQQDISTTFAMNIEDRFAQVECSQDLHGMPLINDAVAHFSCSTHNIVDAGDHIILIGQVEAFDSNDKLGLGYARGGYFSLGLERRAEELTQKQSVIVGAIVEYQDHVLLKHTEQGYCLPEIKSQIGEGSQQAVCDFLSHSGIKAELGSVFSIFESAETNCFSTYYRAVACDSIQTELYELIAIDQLTELKFITSSIQSMMQRYKTEKQNGVFRLYVGNHHYGDIH